MNIEKNVNYWIDLAGYDLETANSMFNIGIYLQLGFLCHQAVEKLIKGYYWKELQDEPPFTDDLLMLSEESSLSDKLTEEQKEFLEFLEPLKHRMRFSESTSEMLLSHPKEEYRDIITKTGEFYKLILQLLNTI